MELVSLWSSKGSRFQVVHNLVEEINFQRKRVDLIDITLAHFEQVYRLENYSEYRLGKVKGIDKEHEAVFATVERTHERDGKTSFKMKFYPLAFNVENRYARIPGSTTILIR